MIAASAAAPDPKRATLPPKTNGWNLKRDQKGKGKTSTNPPIFWGYEYVFGVVFTISPKMSSQKHPKKLVFLQKRKSNNFPRDSPDALAAWPTAFRSITSVAWNAAHIAAPGLVSLSNCWAMRSGKKAWPTAMSPMEQWVPESPVNQTKLAGL